MAGTIFGLGLSQRVDPNGAPEKGWKLYLYTANTTTPVTAYKDTGLTAGQEHPWPIQADAYGMMPSFWLADGSYRARGTSSDGSRTFFDMASVLALGASSGSGGGGTSVDSTTIFQTGDVMWLDVTGTRTGWVRDNGRTIGSASSGATERANSDTQALFEWLWNNFDSLAPVVGGRGASAAADWAANKQITLPDKRGRSPFGLDDMGNSSANRLANISFTAGSAITPGSLGGEGLHTLSESELPSLSKNLAGTAATLKFFYLADGFTLGNTSAARLISASNNGTNTEIDISYTPSGSISFGGGGSHNNMPPFVLGTFYRKL